MQYFEGEICYKQCWDFFTVNSGKCLSARNLGKRENTDFLLMRVDCREENWLQNPIDTGEGIPGSER